MTSVVTRWLRNPPIIVREHRCGHAPVYRHAKDKSTTDLEALPTFKWSRTNRGVSCSLRSGGITGNNNSYYKTVQQRARWPGEGEAHQGASSTSSSGREMSRESCVHQPALVQLDNSCPASYASTRESNRMYQCHMDEVGEGRSDRARGTSNDTDVQESWA